MAKVHIVRDPPQPVPLQLIKEVVISLDYREALDLAMILGNVAGWRGDRLYSALAAAGITYDWRDNLYDGVLYRKVKVQP